MVSQNSKKKSHKIGRNEPCPCKSGKKFKLCHGNVSSSWRIEPTQYTSVEIQNLLNRKEILDIQRKKQQGLGNPIIATEFKDGIAVALGSEVTIYSKAKTFHEVLLAYLIQVFGRDWFTYEVALKENMHPIAKWHLIGSQQALSAKLIAGLTVKSTTMSGAFQAQLGLAWNLFNIQSNLEVQKKLIKRLIIKDHNMSNFMGALYETYIIASFIKAGFKVELEDESDTSTSHGEFIAIHHSGKRYMVEAKTKLPGSRVMGYVKHLHKALSKASKYERIIFLGFNESTLTDSTIIEIQKLLFKKRK